MKIKEKIQVKINKRKVKKNIEKNMLYLNAEKYNIKDNLFLYGFSNIISYIEDFSYTIIKN